MHLYVVSEAAYASVMCPSILLSFFSYEHYYKYLGLDAAREVFRDKGFSSWSDLRELCTIGKGLRFLPLMTVDLFLFFCGTRSCFPTVLLEGKGESSQGDGIKELKTIST